MNFSENSSCMMHGNFVHIVRSSCRLQIVLYLSAIIAHARSYLGSWNLQGLRLFRGVTSVGYIINVLY